MQKGDEEKKERKIEGKGYLRKGMIEFVLHLIQHLSAYTANLIDHRAIIKQELHCSIVIINIIS